MRTSTEGNPGGWAAARLRSWISNGSDESANAPRALAAKTWSSIDKSTVMRDFFGILRILAKGRLPKIRRNRADRPIACSSSRRSLKFDRKALGHEARTAPPREARHEHQGW
jgi:hypothetical protein